ncbi:hypothetical protein [Mucilaginibacter sp. BT774]|uniref:hypothetical protein n=1 Tax=Mucilaginibacter sp. BT774 TaxID=3062276 RepID=UPI00267560D3|nr:hypothetical protein [Mucilaginibacter sp. BT774]MDO3626734.1 hypothetical protein [Mucilaginibacter sp. BT774]
MRGNTLLLISFLLFGWPYLIHAQDVQVQKGMVFKAGTNLRLCGVRIVNTKTSTSTVTNLYGDFFIAASVNDTLNVSCDDYTSTQLVVTDLVDKVVFVEPAYPLSEVVIKENTVLADLNSVKRGYRKKSVFYTGTPHYYYLVLKPMTFIYENFKSEVINARKFNRFAKDEIAYYEVAARFTDEVIKKNAPINENELDDFKADYWPTAQQIRSWNDYDLVNYVIKSYQDFKKNKDVDMINNK